MVDHRDGEWHCSKLWCQRFCVWTGNLLLVLGKRTFLAQTFNAYCRSCHVRWIFAILAQSLTSWSISGHSKGDGVDQDEPLGPAEIPAKQWVDRNHHVEWSLDLKTYMCKIQKFWIFWVEREQGVKNNWGHAWNFNFTVPAKLPGFQHLPRP